MVFLRSVKRLVNSDCPRGEKCLTIATSKVLSGGSSSSKAWASVSHRWCTIDGCGPLLANQRTGYSGGGEQSEERGHKCSGWHFHVEVDALMR